MKTKIAYKFLPFVLLMLVMGCSKKEDVDPRDQYVGDWLTTSITANGVKQSIGTSLSKITISKSSGSPTGLTLGAFVPVDATFTLNGTKITADNPNLPVGSYTFPDKSVSTQYFQNISGTFNSGKFTLSYTAYAESATYKGSNAYVYEFTK